MTKILLALMKDDQIGPNLGFKGGTCALFFYDLPRMSVDLDFDLMDGDVEDMYNHITKVLASFGTIHDAKNKHYTLFRDVIYATNNRHVKIEISKRGPRGEYVSKNFLGEQIHIMTQQDMFTNKLIALLHRSAITNRDIFDIRYFLQNGMRVNMELLKDLVDVGANEYMQKVRNFIAQYDFGKVLYGLGELLDTKQKSFAKTKMKHEILGYLDLMML